MLRCELSCILDEADNDKEAAELKWSLDNLIAAYKAKLDVEERNGENYGRNLATVIMKSEL